MATEWKKIFIDLRAIKYDSARLFLRQLENTVDLTKWINEGIAAGEIDSNSFTLNTLTANTQLLAVGTSGTDFNISSSTATHTFNLPIASALNTGKLSAADWIRFDNIANYDFNNGITAASQEVKLGGALNQNTTISGAYDLYFTNTRVGFGTNAPSSTAKITVVSTGTLGSFLLKNTTSTTGGGIVFDNQSDVNTWRVGNYGASNSFEINYGGTTRGIFINSNGAVGIGSTLTTYKCTIGAAGYTNTSILQVVNSVNAKAYDVTSSGGVISQAWFGNSPINRPTTAHASATFVANAGTAINSASTFDGYTVAQIVKLLRDLGLAT